MTTHATTTPADDRLEGAEEIAGFLGAPLRRTRYLIATGRLPVGREGPGRIVASKRVLLRHWQRLTAGDDTPPAAA